MVKQNFHTLRYFDSDRSRSSLLDYVIHKNFQGDYFHFLARLDRILSEKSDAFHIADFLENYRIPKAGSSLLSFIVSLLQKRELKVISQIWMYRVKAYREWETEIKGGYQDAKVDLPTHTPEKNTGKSVSVRPQAKSLDNSVVRASGVGAIDKIVNEEFHGNVENFLSSLQDAVYRGDISALIQTHNISQGKEDLASIISLICNKDAKVTLPGNWTRHIKKFHKRNIAASKASRKPFATERKGNMDASLEGPQIGELEQCVEEKFDGSMTFFLHCLYNAENQGEGIPVFARKHGLSQIRGLLYAIGSRLRNMHSPLRLPEQWEQHTRAFNLDNTTPQKPATEVSALQHPRSILASNLGSHSTKSSCDPILKSPNPASAVNEAVSNDEKASTAGNNALETLVVKQFRGNVSEFLIHVRDAAQQVGFRAAIFAQKRNIAVGYVHAILANLRDPASSSHRILPESWKPCIAAVRSNTQKMDSAFQNSSMKTSTTGLPGLLVRRLPKYPEGSNKSSKYPVVSQRGTHGKSAFTSNQSWKVTNFMCSSGSLRPSISQNVQSFTHGENIHSSSPLPVVETLTILRNSHRREGTKST